MQSQGIVIRGNNTFLADGKKSIRVQQDEIVKREMGPFLIRLNYPQSVIVDDPHKNPLAISWSVDLEFPITVTITTKGAWNPPCGWNFPLTKKQFDRSYTRDWQRFVTWENCVHCWGYRKRWAAIFPMEFEVTVTDKNGRKSESADMKVVFIVDK